MSHSHPILINNHWQPARSSGTIRAVNPATAAELPDAYPISTWEDCAAALGSADKAFAALLYIPAETRAAFLEAYAALLEVNGESLCAMATLETALPITPRLKDVELPRTVNQLRQAAAAARDHSWCLPTIDTRINLRSCLGPVGPVLIMGPNNFPFAYNAIAGGDFASAIAAGNPVIAKAHPSHPGTTRLLAELALQAATQTKLPPGTVQLLYHLAPEDGLKMIADPRLASVGFTGSRAGGLKLKAAADAAGKPFFAELSSINPVILLPHALQESLDSIIAQYVTSGLAGTGQFCTNPGLVFLLDTPESAAFIAGVTAKYAAAPVGTLLSEGVSKNLSSAIEKLQAAGAQLLTSPGVCTAPGFCHSNTLLRTSGQNFLAHPAGLQTEAFGNAALFVVATSIDEIEAAIHTLEGNLTGCIYSHTQGHDDAAYARLAPVLRQKVGRLLNDKMPTGVAVSSAMNHGGPFPATTQPHFTAVGFPAAIRRFSMLQCYDNVREPRLPLILQNKNPTHMQRFINTQWTTAEIE